MSACQEPSVTDGIKKSSIGIWVWTPVEATAGVLGYPGGNHAPRVFRPRPRPGRRVQWREADLAAGIAAVLAVGSAAMLRVSELSALCWRDIEADGEHTVTIRRSKTALARRSMSGRRL